MEWLFGSSCVKVPALLTALHTHYLLCLFLSEGVAGSEMCWDVMLWEKSSEFLWKTCCIRDDSVTVCLLPFPASVRVLPFAFFVNQWKLSLDNHSFKSSLNICVWFVALLLLGENCWKMHSDGTLKLTGAKHSCCTSKVLSLNIPGQLDPDVRLVGHFKADCKVCGCEHEWLSVFSPAFVTD